MKCLNILVYVIIGFSSVFAQRTNRAPVIVTQPPGTPLIRDNDVPITDQSSYSDLKHSKKQKNNIPNSGAKRVLRQMNILPIGEGGGLLSNLNSDDDFIYLHTEAYDKNIANLWRNDFKIDYKFDFIGEQTDSVFHYALFNQFLRKNQVVLLKTSIKSGIRNQVEGNLPEGMKIITFRVVNQNCFIACTYKEKPIAIVFNSMDGSFKVLPNLLNRNAKFLSLYADNQSFTVILKQMAKGDLLIKKYSNQGKMIGNVEILDTKKHFNEAKIIDFGERQLIVGTFSKGFQYRLQGMFVVVIEADFKTKNIKYFDFKDFPNLMNEKHKIAPYTITHTLKKMGDKILGTIELFDANIINQDYAGRIKYDKSLIFCLDNEGNFVWKNTVLMNGFSKFIYAARLPFGIPSKNELLESSVKPILKTLIDNQQVIVAFQSENQIFTTKFNAQTGEKINIGLYQEKENEVMMGFSPWFGSNFLLWGRERNSQISAVNLYMRKVEVIK